MKLKSLIITSALLLAACGYTQAQSTQVIAHRGFWKTDGSAQNSIAALVKADSINCYGSEFDVWLTADNQLVVNHDSTFKGVNMQKSTAQQCTAVILDNGEQLPTLRQYLEKAGQLKTRLILELKSHKTPEQETRAVESIVKMVKDMGLENRMEYIAFSRHERIYPSYPQRNFGILSGRRPLSQRTERMGMRRTRLSLQRIQKTSRMD